DGHLVEQNMALASGLVAGELLRRLGNFCHEKPIAFPVSSDTTYQCFPDDPMRVRRPDVSAIRFGRLPRNQLYEGHVRIAPDVAVEVVSPNDLFSDVERKVQEYLEAGVQLVWVVNPEIRIVAVHRADGSIAKLHEKDELTGENVLPGFRCPVGDLFRPLDQLQTAP